MGIDMMLHQTVVMGVMIARVVIASMIDCCVVDCRVVETWRRRKDKHLR